MVYFDLKNQKAECPPITCPSVAALGIFDGVHIGHASLIARAIKERDKLRKKSIPAVCIVWSLFETPKCASSITTLEEKLNLFAEFGVDYAVIEHFDEVKHLSPEEFVADTLISKLDCRCAVCGFNFHFGSGGKGDAETLSRLLSQSGASTAVVPPVVCENGSLVSSSIIRTLIENGETGEASTLLGRPFSINFPIVHGKHLGRTIGIPTVNQNFPDGHIIPRRGIYASLVDIDGEKFMGVTNIGLRPTFENHAAVNSETHIIDYSGFLYEKKIKVSFYKRLRDEIKFSSSDELCRQIAEDIKLTREYFLSHTR